MSRRRKRSERAVVEYPIDVVCTGRGTHRRLELRRLAYWAAPLGAVDVVGGADDWFFVEPDPDTVRAWWANPESAPVPMGHETLTVRCLLCRTASGKGRTVPLRREKLVSVAETLRHSGLHDLDVSRLAAIL